MSNRTLALTDSIYDYLVEASLRESPLLRRLRDETAEMGQSNMQIAPEQGQLMGLLVRLIGARRALEVAAAGGHHLLLMGPPGCGKSMLARRLPGVLPPLGVEEALEVTRIHGVTGRIASLIWLQNP